MNHILIVCVGNICRSPMAQALLAQKNAHLGIQVSSAGIAALVDYPADKHAQQLMQEMGLDISQHRARQLTLELLNQADLVLAMKQAHIKTITQQFPTALGKVYRLGKWGDFDIMDPYQQDLAAFRLALTLIERSISDWQRKYLCLV